MNVEAINKLLNIALQEEGYLEKKSNSQLESKTANAGDNNYTKYADYLDRMNYFNGKKNGYAWCASFVCWCLVKAFGKETAMKIANHPTKDNQAAGCSSAMNYYKQMNRFYKTTPQPGDQIFFTNDGGKSSNHTGLVTKVGNSIVYTIEGNTSSTIGVVPNGGCVRQKSYPLTYNKIAGYGRPKYELIPEEEEEMTQEQFNKFMDNYIEELANRPVTWEQSALDWAVAQGLFKGDEQNRLMPKKFMTRGELATVLQRALCK